MQFTGTAQAVEPAAGKLELFAPVPHFTDAVFDPVHMRIEPQFVTVHPLSGNPDREYEHAL
ncbi:hypothetical protein OV450_5504 [Actinobacteria bacterium OV450]|nr:hypothetical protein OV450_5504 [Actinobacteria bacterium OV450]